MKFGVGFPFINSLLLMIVRILRGVVASIFATGIAAVFPLIICDGVEPPLFTAVTLIIYGVSGDRPLNIIGLDCFVGIVTPSEGLTLYVYDVAPAAPVQLTVRDSLFLSVIVSTGWEGGNVTERLGPSVEPDIFTALTIILCGPGVIFVNVAILLATVLQLAGWSSIM
jgi:hypothetical protein